jgi:hypothetical protein
VVAAEMFSNRSVGNMARKIRQWAMYFVQNKELSGHMQGRHMKTKSLIDDEDIASACRAWLRTQRSDTISPLSFCRWVLDELCKISSLPHPVIIS